MSTCRTCQGPLLWATTPSGKSIPLDPEPVPRGNVELRDGVAHIVTPDATPRYQSHFASCPQANGHRRTRLR